MATHLATKMSHDVVSKWSSSYSYEQIREHRFEDQGFQAAFMPDNMGFSNVEPHGLQAQIQWRQGPKAQVFVGHLPGVRLNEVRLKLEEDERVLCVTTEKKVTREETMDTWHRIEYSIDRFVQRLKLPEDARVDHMRTYMDNDVLTIYFKTRPFWLNRLQTSIIDGTGRLIGDLKKKTVGGLRW